MIFRYLFLVNLTKDTFCCVFLIFYLVFRVLSYFLIFVLFCFREMEALTPSIQAAVIQVDATTLKSIFTPSAQFCLTCVEKLLPSEASSLCGALLSEMQSTIKKLSTFPQGVEESVDYLTFLRDRVYNQSATEQVNFLYTFLQE